MFALRRRSNRQWIGESNFAAMDNGRILVMITIQLQKDYDAPPETVFDLLADHTKFPVWDPYIIEVTLSSEGPIREGSRGVTVGKLMGRRVESEIYYDSYDRPKFVSGGTASGSVIAKNSVEFMPTKLGTHVDFHLDVEFKGPMRLLEPFMKGVIARQKQESLEALNDYITRNRLPGDYV
jgi:carbon monoxide dehydrogenase subunit G